MTFRFFTLSADNVPASNARKHETQHSLRDHRSAIPDSVSAQAGLAVGVGDGLFRGIVAATIAKDALEPVAWTV